MISSKKLSHLDQSGNPLMVDVSAKKTTTRMAIASATVVLPAACMKVLKKNDMHVAKGSVTQTANLAGIMAAKRTSDLIPLCHPLAIEKVQIDIKTKGNTFHITAMVKTEGKTGVEMEALTAASASALTIYDMCKALSHDIVISEIKLESKTGGKNDFTR